METEALTEIICILDKSGSMSHLREDTVAGLNFFLENQKLVEGPCNFTLVQFNQEVTSTIKQQPIKNVQSILLDYYQPNGYTALLDAVGTTLKIAMETQFYLPVEQTPDRVLVFIITDGLENASKVYKRVQIQQLIHNLSTVKGWEFQFFGANMDAFAEAEHIGISEDEARQWEYSKKGVNLMMNEMNEKSVAFRKRK